MRKVVAICAVLSLFAATPVSALEFSLFGDVSLIGPRDEAGTSFQLGEVDLMADQEVGDNSRAMVEVVFEDAGHGFAIDVERFFVSYTVDDPLQVAAGRFHTPLGFWNYNFHHGLLVQDTITRPFFIEFEDAHEGVFATHMVGMLAWGELPWSSVLLDYKFGISNSPSIDTTDSDHHGAHELEVNNDQDLSDSKSVVLRLGVISEEETWGLGLSGMYNHIVESGEADPDPAAVQPLLEHGEVLFDQTIVGVDLQYRKDLYYLYGEYFQISITDSQHINSPPLVARDQPYTGTAWYVQLGYRLRDKYNLALRREVLDFDDKGTYFKLLKVSSQSRTVAALRYDLEESSGLRLQYSEVTDTLSGESNSHWALQWFFLVF